MSSSRWTPQKDAILVEKYDELKGDFEQITFFFPDKNSRTLKRRYQKIEQMASNNDLSIEEFIIKRNDHGPIEIIEEILSTENRNDRILHKLIKNEYQLSDVVTAILNLANKNILWCSKLVFIFQYLMIEWDSKIITTLYKISLEIKSIHFLQQCCFFNILCYDEIIKNVPYVSKFNQFLSFPKIAIQSRDDITKLSRLEKNKKHSQLRIQKLLSDNDKLKIKINELKEAIKNMKCDMRIAQKNFYDIEQEIIRLNSENYHMILGNIEAFYNENLERNYVLQKKKVEKYYFFAQMINHFLKNENHPNFFKFCSLFYLLNKNSYLYLQKTLPVLSPSACKYFINPLKTEIKNMLTDKKYILPLLEIYYKDLIKFENHKPQERIRITLAGDAASLKPLNNSKNEAVYVFHFLPLDGRLPPAVIHMMPCKNGPSSQEVLNTFEEISVYLKKIGFDVQYHATDGDISFDSIHNTFFETHIQEILDKNFQEILTICSKLQTIPLSDPLHLFKGARGKLINHLMMIDIENLRCVNTKLFAEAVELGSVFKDTSSAGSMKDEYAILMFSWFALTETLRKGRYDASYFLLPYVFLMEALKSPLLSVSKRLEFLGSAFTIFRNHYHCIMNAPKNDLFRQRFKQCCIGTYFADKIFLRRIMNSIIGIGVALIKGADFLCLQRLGSHDAELFFAQMRFFSFNDNTYSNAIRVAVRSILIKKYSHEVNYSVKIHKRENNAGITLDSDINNQEEFEFDCEKFSYIVQQLMLGNSVSQENYQLLAKFTNNYSTLISSCKNYKLPKKLHLMSGRLPMFRYQSMSFTQSVLLIPQKGSVFDYYMKNKNKKKCEEQIATLEWCINVINALHLLDEPSKTEVTYHIHIPFEYDIINNSDRKKILEFINDTTLSFNNPQSPRINPSTDYQNEDELSDSDEISNDFKNQQNDQIIYSLDDHESEINADSQILNSELADESVQISQTILDEVDVELHIEAKESEKQQKTKVKKALLNQTNEYILRKDLTKTINLLLDLFYERNDKLNMNNLIKPVMAESTYSNEKSLDDEFNDAINYFDTSNLIQNNS